MRRTIPLLPLCALLAALAGCGQKGPLYLPPHAAAAHAGTTVAPPVPPSLAIPDYEQPSVGQH